MEAYEAEYRRYVQKVNESDLGDMTRRWDAYCEYVRAISEAHSPEKIRQQILEAYRRYLRAQQEAWSAVDVDLLVRAMSAS